MVDDARELTGRLAKLPGGLRVELPDQAVVIEPSHHRRRRTDESE